MKVNDTGATDSAVPLRRTYNRLHVRPDGFIEGSIVTPHGIVDVVAGDGAPQCDWYAALDMVISGYHYTRIFIGRPMTKRGLSVKANQFAREAGKGMVK